MWMSALTGVILCCASSVTVLALCLKSLYFKHNRKNATLTQDFIFYMKTSFHPRKTGRNWPMFFIGLGLRNSFARSLLGGNGYFIAFLAGLLFGQILHDFKLKKLNVNLPYCRSL